MEMYGGFPGVLVPSKLDLLQGAGALEILRRLQAKSVVYFTNIFKHYIFTWCLVVVLCSKSVAG